jgi:hypothetical protein
LSQYGTHLQDILFLFMFIVTEDPVKKNAAKVTEELRIVIWRPVYSKYAGLQRAPDWDFFHSQYYSAKPAFARAP